MVSWRVFVLSAVCCCAVALPAPRTSPRATPRATPRAIIPHAAPRGAASIPIDTSVDLSPATPQSEGFRLNVFPLPDPSLDGTLDDPTRQLSPSTQSFLSTLGTALGPIVGAIVGPLLTNIGQNLSAGSGAQAISQLQQAAQVAAAAQQGQPGTVPVQNSVGNVAASNNPTAGPVRPPGPPRPGRPNTGRPVRPPRPTARPAARPASSSSTARPPQPQSFDAFVLDVPGRGPFLFLMTPNASKAQQSAAIQQAQQQATQLFSANNGLPSSQPWPLTDGVVSALVTKPTSVGPLPVRPGIHGSSQLTSQGSNPGLSIPSYHSLLEDEDSAEEVAVADTFTPEMPEHIGGSRVHNQHQEGQVQVHPTTRLTKEEEGDNSQSLEDFDESLSDSFFPEMS